MIGKRAIFPICQSVTISTVPVPSPTPTPTVTPTLTPGLSPTPTPTPATIYTSGATINVTETGYIKYTSSTGSTYQFMNTLGSNTLPGCLLCDTIMIGIPFFDVADFTITSCGTTCGGPAPTPQPSSTPISYGHYIMVDCQTYQTRYSQSLPYGTYNSGDRVEGSYGYFYVINGFTPSTPDPSLIFYVSSTGNYGCP
jgi:hypothetical protein